MADRAHYSEMRTLICLQAQCHASCHEGQSRRQEKIGHDLTGNTGIPLSYLACFSSPLSIRFPEMGRFSWKKSVKSCIFLPVLSCPARIASYFALHDSLRDTGPQTLHGQHCHVLSC